MRLLLTLVLATSMVAALGCGTDVPPPDTSEPDAGTKVPPPPPPAQCDPACTESQRCDTTGAEPVCVEICNTPNGCNPGFEVCNTTTAECEPLDCNGEKCSLGQVCVDVTRSNFPPRGDNGVCSCTPAYQSGEASYPDSCNVYGMVCAFNRATRQPASCVMPGEGDPCIQTIGCDQTSGTLECRTVNSNDICTRPCTTSDDCASATDACASTGYCEPNRCARRQDGTLDRAQLFQPCDARGTGDGTCLPRMIGGRESALCVQNGTAATGEECYPEATRAEADKLCGAGDVCEAIQPHETKPDRTRGICFKACNASTSQQANPRLTCAAGTRCYAIAQGSNATRLGACHAECDLVGGTEDCPNDALGNAVGCFQWSSRDAAKGYCLSIHPDAPVSAGAACATTGSADERNSCGSRMSCVGRNNPKCFEYCDISLCPDSRQSCPHCDASASRCARVGNDNQARVGVCQP